ncbi:MAG: hypothetical protein OXJ55_17615 [Caldilineaceae bacterium]|nr:hypothetical protein [Caldilineaceae bacterium]MDE0461694.1 hypothetical protein [Caldilineaceae bacterium]MDE0462984.1 hypothetical protein [Caldilineaceae bacterium]
MMIDPDRFADALYASPPLDVVETRILEMLAAAENEFVPLSVLHDASGLSYGHFFNAWGLMWKKFYDACACSLCRRKKKDKIFHILDGLRLAESDEFSYRLPAPLRELVNQWLDDESVLNSRQVAANRLT